MDRRTVLKSVGVTMALPWLECMSRGAEHTEPRKRFFAGFFAWESSKMVAEQKRKRNTGKFDKQGVVKYTKKDNT